MLNTILRQAPMIALPGAHIDPNGLGGPLYGCRQASGSQELDSRQANPTI